jgi:hypothetical protein
VNENPRNECSVLSSLAPTSYDGGTSSALGESETGSGEKTKRHKFKSYFLYVNNTCNRGNDAIEAPQHLELAADRYQWDQEEKSLRVGANVFFSRLLTGAQRNYQQLLERLMSRFGN